MMAGPLLGWFWLPCVWIVAVLLACAKKTTQRGKGKALEKQPGRVGAGRPVRKRQPGDGKLKVNDDSTQESVNILPVQEEPSPVKPPSPVRPANMSFKSLADLRMTAFEANTKQGARPPPLPDSPPASSHEPTKSGKPPTSTAPRTSSKAPLSRLPTTSGKPSTAPPPVSSIPAGPEHRVEAEAPLGPLPPTAAAPSLLKPITVTQAPRLVV